MERASPELLSLHLASSVPPVLVSSAPLVLSPWRNCRVTPVLLFPHAPPSPQLAAEEEEEEAGADDESAVGLYSWSFL